MKHRIITAAGTLTLAVTLSPASTMAQQNTRSFVSGHGSDSNTCTLAAPCRTFQHAHDVTNPGGEVAVLDTAGYGPLSINKAISIVNPGGVEAGIVASTGNDAITITAQPNDKIALRGLTIEGAGVGANGIVLNSGANLDIADSVVRNFTVDGIHLSPTVNSTFAILDTIVSDNVGVGIFIIPSGDVAINGAITGVTANNNYDGILLDGANSTLHIEPNTVTVSRSVASNNKYTGFYCAGGPRAPFQLVLQNVTANNNQYGIKGDSGYAVNIFIFSSVSIGNPTSDVFNNGANITSYGNNAFGVTSGVTVVSAN